MKENYELMVKGEFSSAHFLREYQGKCENLHGHNWKVQVFIKSKKLNKIGIAEDFKVLKKHLNDCLDKLDHTLINNIGFFKKTNPSSENIAKYIFNAMKKQIKNISKVSVWESDTSCATYSPNNS